jgi:flagellar basal-body rod protein FlgB
VDAISRYDTTTVLEKALPVIEQSHRVLANNVANANTPGFVPTHVAFKESLRRALEGVGNAPLALKTTHSNHIMHERNLSGLAFESDMLELSRNDKSTFSIDKEMVELERNGGRYQIFSAMLTKRYQQIREVLRMP